MKALNGITLFKCTFKFVIVFVLALNFSTALGQEKAKDSDEYTLEEIVVTAEFREKQLQDTPLAITAISADTLEMRSQVSLEQIALETPNVSLRPGNAGYGSALTAYIRGVGQVDFNPSVEEGVGIYVDDVYYNTITGNILDLLDLERVEVLRGPQGTLAGRNALGGAIKLFSRKPEGRDEGFFSITAGTYNRLDIRGAADFAISDNLFMRIAGTSKSREGYVTRFDYKCTHPNSALPTFVTGAGCELGKEGGQSVTAGRLSLRWVPSDRFELNFSTNIVNDTSEATASILIDAKDNGTSSFPWYTPNVPGDAPNNPSWVPTADSGVSVPVYYDVNGNGTYEAGIDVAHDRRFVTAGSYYNYSTYMHAGISSPDPLFQGGYSISTVPPVNTMESRDYTLNLDFNFNENISLKSITSYREYTNIFGHDVDGSPLTIQSLQERMRHHQFTQELRLNSTLFDGFADTTLGVFYLDKKTTEDARVSLPYVGLDFLHGPDLTPSTSEAVYGQASLHLTEQMDLTLGARYSKDEKSYTWQRHNPDGTDVQPATTIWTWEAGNPTNAGVWGYSGDTKSYSSTSFDYRIALDYDINENIMAYAQVATGYRMGGNNARPFNYQQHHIFNPEELINYEVGVKSTLFDQLRLNTSIFYNKYKDIQLPLNSCYWTDPGFEVPCASQDNVGDAKVKGIEIEGIWRPTKAFLADFSYSYLDFEYTRLSPNTNVDPGSTTPYTPKQKYSLGAQYRLFLRNGGDVTYRADYSWQDQVYAGAINTAGSIIGSYGLLNARMTWRSADLKWQMSFEVTNLLDKYYYLTIFELLNDAGFANAQPGHPREYALTIKRVWYLDE